MLDLQRAQYRRNPEERRKAIETVDFLRGHRAGADGIRKNAERQLRQPGELLGRRLWATLIVEKTKSSTVYRPVLGLPLSQRYSDKRTFESSYKKYERWASPLHLKVIRCGKDYHPLLVTFPRMVIPEGDRINVCERTKGGTGREYHPALSHDLLREMLKPVSGGTVLSAVAL